MAPIYHLGQQQCYKYYLGLGNRSIFCPYSSVGNTITFDVVEDTGSNLVSNVSFIEALACPSLNACIFPVSQLVIEAKRGGQCTAVRGIDAPNIPPIRGGGECCTDCPGLGNRSTFYPYSSVGNISTITIVFSLLSMGGGGGHLTSCTALVV